MRSLKQLRRRPSVTIAIPASLVSDTPHLREKTFKIGMIGRAAAIFRIDEIIVYQDELSREVKEDELIVSILTYLETPQYLRKRLFPFNPSFRYVGILPPLRTFHHPLEKRVEDLETGQLREGVVVKSDEEQSYVDIGVDSLALLEEPNFSVGRRVTVKILAFQRNMPVVCLVDREEIDIYWGYDASVSTLTLGQILKKDVFDLVVLTSRYGKSLTKAVEVLKDRWRTANKVLIVFGSPRKGLREILEEDRMNIDEVDAVVVNTVPGQGTETIRTEEAVYATFAAINILIKKEDKDGP